MNEIPDLITVFLQSPLFPVIFIGGWIAVGFSLAKKSGWSKFKEKYKAIDLDKNIKFHSGSGKIGGIFYRGMLLVGTTESSLILKVWFPWRFGHPTLTIPWEFISKIQIAEDTLSTDNFLNLKLRERISKKAFFAKYAEVSLLEHPEIYIELPWNDFLSENVPSEKRLITVRWQE